MLHAHIYCVSLIHILCLTSHVRTACASEVRPFNTPTAPRAARAAMALSKLSGDEQRILFTQLCNVLEPRRAVYLSSISNELREPTQALLQQLKADHEAAAALCRKVGLRSCKELREAKEGNWYASCRSRPGVAGHAGLGAACARVAGPQ